MKYVAPSLFNKNYAKVCLQTGMLECNLISCLISKWSLFSILHIPSPHIGSIVCLLY